MKLKEGVILEGVQWQMFWAAIIVEDVYKKRGQECIITSANDGRHGDKTLHHKGLALDIRTWTVTAHLKEIHAELKERLGDNFDVVLERDHFHIEFDPS